MPEIWPILRRNYLSERAIFGDKWIARDYPEIFGKIMGDRSFSDEAPF